jgi:hypothetical protein
MNSDVPFPSHGVAAEDLPQAKLPRMATPADEPEWLAASLFYGQRPRRSTCIEPALSPQLSPSWMDAALKRCHLSLGQS